MIFNLSICLTDIPKEKITTAGNGKMYVNITAADLREPDKFGKDVSAWITQSKEERADKNAKRTFVGNGNKFNTKQGVDQHPFGGQ